MAARGHTQARGGFLRAAAVELRRTIDASAELMALEMGKPLAQGRAEVEKCAATCEFFAEHGPGFLAPETIPGTGERAFVAFEPLGVVLAIMPWNFPFWQIFRCAIPALLAGNAVIFKPALNTAGCGLAVQRIFKAAGLPKGLFSTLLITEKHIPAVIKADCVRAVSLTGSTRAGRAVASLAGAHLKKTVLELGGSDPYVVLADCDLDQAAKTCVNSRMLNGGQSCIAAKRFIVERSIRQAIRKPFCRTHARAAGHGRSARAHDDFLVHLPAKICVTPCILKSAEASPAAQNYCWAAKSPVAPAGSIRQPFSQMSTQACPPRMRKLSVPWPQSLLRRTKPKPFAWPIRPRSGWALRCSLATASEAKASPRGNCRPEIVL